MCLCMYVNLSGLCVLLFVFYVWIIEMQELILTHQMSCFVPDLGMKN